MDFLTEKVDFFTVFQHHTRKKVHLVLDFFIAKNAHLCVVHKKPSIALCIFSSTKKRLLAFFAKSLCLI
jgi:hypothetical protein